MNEHLEVNYISVLPIVHLKSVLTKEQCRAISDEIRLMRSQQSDTVDGNDGCWRANMAIIERDGIGISRYNAEAIMYCIQSATDKFLAATRVDSQLFKTSQTIPEFDPSRMAVDAWFNVNEQNAKNVVHTHSLNFASGTIYFQSTGTGEIVFKTLESIYKFNNPLWPFEGSAKYEPEDGDILIFPAFLAHWVDNNPSEHERINLAFNINYGL